MLIKTKLEMNKDGEVTRVRVCVDDKDTGNRVLNVLERRMPRN